jgi:apolipoprotein N-acyltransferase
VTARTWTAIAAVSGAIFALVGPPTDLLPAEAIGLAGFALCLSRAPGAMRGLAFGLGANVVALRFVPTTIARFTPLPWAVGAVALVLLSAAQGLVWLAAAWSHHRLLRAGFPQWAAFACAVYLGCFVPAVFPWTPAGGLTPWPVFVQAADLAGERGVSALLALAVGLAVEAIRTRRWKLALPSALVLSAWLGYGAFRMRDVAAQHDAAPSARVGLVQPSFEARERWEPGRAQSLLDQLTTLTRSAERRGAEVTVWPESAYPYRVPQAARRGPSGRDAVVQPAVRGPVLTGLYTTPAEGGGSYNAAALAFADGTLQEPYAKMHLLWFGETVPLADVFPWMRKVFARGLGILPGEKQVLMTAPRDPKPALRMIVLNCFEDTLPGVTREAFRQVAAPPNLLVNVTNDAWFSGTRESELHLRMAVLRSVESRRDLVRAVNFGVTSWVDAVGRVRLRYDSPLPGAPVAEPALLEGTTIFMRAGDLPGLLVVLAALGARVRRQWQAHKKTEGAEP